MTTDSAPTWGSFAFDVPEPQNLSGDFIYNYFLKNERVSSNSKSDSDALKRHGDKPARCIKLTFTSLSKITTLKDPLRTKFQRKTDLIERNNLIVSEIGAQTQRTSFVAVQDDSLAQQMQSIIDAELLSAKVETRGLSPLEATLKYNSITSNKINAVDILETTDIEASSNLTYYDPATGEDLTVQKQGGVSEYAIGGFYNKKFLYDILKGSENSPFSPLWGNINSVLEEASNIQENSISTLDSNKITMEDYELPVSYLPDSKQSLSDFTAYDQNVDICGYAIQKKEVHPDGTTSLVEVIPIVDLDLTEYLDNKVIYGKRYRYSITSVFYLSTIITSAGTAAEEALYATYMVGSRGSPYIDVLCEETVPPPPPNNIEFFLSQEQKLIMFWDMPYNTQEDIKRFQIFKRLSLEEPYTIIEEIDFDDSEILTERSEYIPDYSKKIMESSALSLTFTDDEFEFDQEFYYAICSIDAHDLSSPYSSQFKVKYDRVDGKMKTELIGFAGAPKPYPNFTLKETLIVDCLKDSGHSKMKVYFDPECLVLQGASKESLEGSSYREDLDFIETNNSFPMYKMQIINLDRQQDEKLNIYLKNNGYPTLPPEVADKIPHQDITD